MSRTLYRQLVGHEDLALGFGKVNQLRGDRLLSFRQIMLEFIFETVDEIKELDYTRYTHVALHVVGPVTQYYYNPLSYAVPDDYDVIKPNSVQLTQAGRWIRIGSDDDDSQANNISDTIIASASDEFTELVIGVPRDYTTYRAPYPFNMHNGYVRASLTVAPTGSPMIIDMTMNGVSIFSTPIYIDAGELTSVTASIQSVLNITYVPDDAEFLPYITQIGSTFAGSGLKVALTGAKVIL